MASIPEQTIVDYPCPSFSTGLPLEITKPPGLNVYMIGSLMFRPQTGLGDAELDTGVTVQSLLTPDATVGVTVRAQPY